MSTPEGAPAPVVVTPPATPPAPPTPPPATVPQPPDESQPWFQERLSRAKSQEREALLAELGVKDPKVAKAAIDAAKKAEDDAKSVTDKLTETTSKLTRSETEAERLRSITTEWATRQMMALSAEQQTAVKAIAGEDAAAQLKAITALTPTWAAATPPAPVPPAKPVPPASGTAPPPTAPPGTTVSEPNHAEVHAALLKTNPFAAADYAMAHLREVFPNQTQ